jgi:hypothetical protein
MDRTVHRIVPTIVTITPVMLCLVYVYMVVEKVIYKYVVDLMNTRLYRSTEQHSFAFALTKSSFKLYHIL